MEWMLHVQDSWCPNSTLPQRRSLCARAPWSLLRRGTQTMGHGHEAPPGGGEEPALLATAAAHKQQGVSGALAGCRRRGPGSPRV